jgi:hypothetical protein
MCDVVMVGRMASLSVMQSISSQCFLEFLPYDSTVDALAACNAAWESIDDGGRSAMVLGTVGRDGLTRRSEGVGGGGFLFDGAGDSWLWGAGAGEWSPVRR